MRIAATALAAALLVGACGATDAASDRSITVAAASDLRPAFEALGAEFTEATGTEIVFSFGSSGLLREQIVNGAPFDVFASANVAFVDDVVAAGRGDPDTLADYALGRIVLWAADGIPLPERIEDLADTTYRRIAIANPTHAPYGLAAEQALERAGVLDAVDDRLVYGENISDTHRLAISGNVDVAIVALSLAIANGAPYTLVPEDLHEPLRQALVVTATGSSAPAAREFATFLGSPAGRAVMNRFGFTLPGERTSDGAG